MVAPSRPHLKRNFIQWLEEIHRLSFWSFRQTGTDLMATFNFYANAIEC